MQSIHFLAWVPVSALALGSLAWLLANQEKLSRRVDRAVDLERKQWDSSGDGKIYVRIVAAIGVAVIHSGFLKDPALQKIRHSLRLSGIRDARSLSVFLGAKIFLAIFFPVFGTTLFSEDLVHTKFLVPIFVTLAIFGLLLPDLFIILKKKKFVERLEAGLADAIDMMIICTDAGLSLEASLARVSLELRASHDAIAEELSNTSQEMRIGSDIRESLTRLGVRTGLKNLKRFSATLTQTLEYGTPLTDALRILSHEIRQEELRKFEERAARLPVLLTVPMIVFILPCVFLVVGGPAILRVMAVFS